jgi:UPF0755 protein
VLKKIIFVTVIVLVATSLGVANYLTKELGTTLNLNSEEVSYSVKPGSSLKRVLSDFEKNNWITYPRVHEFWLRYQEKTNIQRGEYIFTNSMTSSDAIQMLIDGNKIMRSVQFIEGKTFRDNLNVLENSEFIQQTLQGLTLVEVMQQISPEMEFYEGWLFPDTYLFEKGTSDLDILKIAHKRMNQVLKEEWEMRSDDAIVKTPYDALILASIIEKETGAAFERPMISGVFTRRIEQGMRLQTDPTIIYGLGAEFDGNLTRQHLRTDSPYNTYTRSGLPPTPIANPGREAINAALNPADGKAVFFVAKGDGTHQFSVTLKEHNAAVRQYQRFGRRSDYQSAPTVTETSE